MTTPQPRSAQELAEDRTDMATSRTLMAADRTLMAWIRTSLSMLSFGFTIYKVLEGFQQAGRSMPQAAYASERRALPDRAGNPGDGDGHHRGPGRASRRLRRFQPIAFARPSMIMALVMSVGGVFLFFSIITGLF